MVNGSLFADGLLAKGICGLIREEDIYKVKGRPLLNGLFGVPKDEIADGVAVHRLIMNLIPLNRICRPLSGDVSGIFFTAPDKEAIVRFSKSVSHVWI